MPHGMCYLWQPSLVTIHVVGDLLITLAYYSIPAMLIYFVRNREDIPFQWIFWLFGAFIVACGTNHLLEIWTLWHPHYWLSGVMKLVTAGISLYTAFELFPLIPQALALPNPEELEQTNQQLAAEIEEKQRLIAALTESEERFRSIFEGAVIGIGLADMSGKIVTANPALAQMLGYSTSELEGKYFADFTYPDDQDYSEDIYQGMVSGDHQYYQMDQRYLAKNGELKWANLTISLVRGVHRTPQYSLSMVQDITERKQVEAELRQHRERLTELVEERTAEIAKINQQLSWQATHDELTRLLNRRAFAQFLENAVVSAKLCQQEHSLFYMDLDRFKIINDTCGHQAGDELLIQVSRLFQSCCRKSDTLARLGGDEFSLLLTQCSLEQAQKIARTIVEEIRHYRFTWQQESFYIGVSIGVVKINHATINSETILVAADTACYKAKRRGRNQYYIEQEVMEIQEWDTKERVETLEIEE